eukprot:scaffold48406_cov32-Tisochrysis_lutea.AAC.2
MPAGSSSPNAHAHIRFTLRPLLGAQVMGDASPEADKLMRSQGVRALPSFHFWKNSNKLDSISGAQRAPPFNWTALGTQSDPSVYGLVRTCPGPTRWPRSLVQVPRRRH